MSERSQRPIAHLCVFPLEDFRESNFEVSIALQTLHRRRNAPFAWSLHHPPCRLPLLLLLLLPFPFPRPRRLARFSFVNLTLRTVWPSVILYNYLNVATNLGIQVWELR